MGEQARAERKYDMEWTRHFFVDAQPAPWAVCENLNTRGSIAQPARATNGHRPKNQKERRPGKDKQKTRKSDDRKDKPEGLPADHG